MTQQKKNVYVSYDTYEPYEHLPNSNELGYISTDAAQSVMTTIKNTIETNINRCVSRLHVNFSQDLYIYPKSAETQYTDFKKLGISGIMLGGKSWCTKTNYQDMDRAGKNCIKNLQRGKCMCPMMRIIGAVLYPKLYGKGK